MRAQYGAKKHQIGAAFLVSRLFLFERVIVLCFHGVGSGGILLPGLFGHYPLVITSCGYSMSRPKPGSTTLAHFLEQSDDLTKAFSRRAIRSSRPGDHGGDWVIFTAVLLNQPTQIHCPSKDAIQEYSR